MIYYDIHTHQLPVHPEYVAYGIHPWYISDVGRQLAELRRLLGETDIAAIGEAGFDKLAEAPLSLQQEAFVGQARLAEEFGKPLIVHCVKAWDELIAARKQIQPSLPWVIHGFRGNGLLARQLLRQGFLLSFGMHYNEEALRAAWPEALFAETDDCDVDICTVYARIASSLGISIADLARQIAANALRTFPFPSPLLTDIPSNNYQLSIISFQL